MEETKERKVIHLEKDGEHTYYGSMQSLFNYISSEDLGIAYSTLRKFGLSENKPYKNDKCIIRKGTLKTATHKIMK